MELHENLYELGLSFGRDVFNDAEGLRAALDDFLDEGSASTGDINLLVDAVRLGSFRWMLATIESGAEPARAIESAGDLLARDRGSADVVGSRWACAVLGFAVGKVTDTDVRRYRTQGPPTPPVAQPEPTIAPGRPPTTSPPASPPTTPPASPPTSPAFTQAPPQPQPPQAWGQPGAPQVPPLSGPSAQSSRKTSAALPLLVGAGIGLVILAVIFAVLKLTGGDDSEPQADPTGDLTSTATSDPTSGTTSAPPDGMEFADINERYQSLGNRVTTGQSSCAAAETLSGQVEAVECTSPQGTLSLTTYESYDELTSAREREVNTDVGGRFVAQSSIGVLFSFDTDTSVPTLYWDSDGALQSGQYVGGSDAVEVDALASVFRSVGPILKYPEGLSDPALIDFADYWVRPNQCDRIQTLTSGELEESVCKARNQIVVYVAKMATKSDLLTYRQTRLRDSQRDGLSLERPSWMFGTGAAEGRLADSYADNDRILRYWDQTECLCYMEAYYPTVDRDALIKWWEAPRG